MEYGFLLEDCYSPTLVDCRVLNGKYGLVHRAMNMQPEAPEDGIIRGYYFVGQIESVVIDMNKQAPAWPEPGFHIDNCHVNYRDAGIRLQGVQQANISHSLFYCHDRTGTRWFKDGHAMVPGGDAKKRRDYEPRDIDAAYASNLIIDGNIFTEPANFNRVGIRIGPDSGHVLVSGNQFNLSGIAIKNESKQPSYSSGNFFGGKPGWSGNLTPYADPLQTLATRDFPSTEARTTSPADAASSRKQP